MDWLKIELNGCFLPCKGTNFSANHNGILNVHSLSTVVSYPAKVQIFQLITTKGQPISFAHWLYLTLQRYKFFGTMDMFRRQWVRFVISYCPDFANA